MNAVAWLSWGLGRHYDLTQILREIKLTYYYSRSGHRYKLVLWLHAADEGRPEPSCKQDRQNILRVAERGL